jgi:hypothetical protein
MATGMTREQVTAAVAAETAQRDGIQANLLDLDGSFGKRLLAGASLAGETKRRWEAANAELVALWETFTVYSAVVDRAVGLLARVRRPSSPELAGITALLTGTSVRLTRAPAPLARRDLTDAGRSELTLAVAVREMKRAFARVADVVSSAESVWNEVADRLDRVRVELAQARRRADGLADEALAGTLSGAEAELAHLRDLLNSDPLALWQHGVVDTARLDRLGEQAAAAASRAAEVARLRADAQRRIAAVASAVAAAQAAWQDARAAQERAAAKITDSAPPPLPDVASLAGRLSTLDALRAAGRWLRLASELDAIEQQAAAATRRCRDAEQEAVTLLRRRDELRGLLDAYQAMAARHGAVEDIDLTVRYDKARDLLWTAPCDVAAASDAVTGYQEAILAIRLRGRRR